MYTYFFSGVFFIMFMILIIYPVTTNKYSYIEPATNNKEVEIYLDAINKDVSNNTLPPIDEKTKELITYNLNNFDVTYHESPEELEKSYGYGLGLDTTFVFDPSLNKFISMKVPKNQTYPLYNQPGYYKYGNQKYVPTYEDATYLSSRTNMLNKKSEYKQSNINFTSYEKLPTMAVYEPTTG